MKAKRAETLEEIWAIRRQIAKQLGGDPQKRVAYYQRKQKEFGLKIYWPEVTAGADVHTYDALRDRAYAEIAAGQCATLTLHLERMRPIAECSGLHPHSFGKFF